MEVDGLVRGVLAGDRRAVARAISLVEDGRPELARVAAGI
jgi:LAO/AO transport system kinase